MGISVVMAFRNEGQQVAKTIDSLLNSVDKPENLDIVVVNDCSDDGYDYDALRFYPYTRYYINENRIGSSMSKQKAVELAKYDTILLVDAHMRFIDSNWYNTVEEYIAKDKFKIYSLYTIGLNADTDEAIEQNHAGCFIRLSKEKVLNGKWASYYLDEGDSSRIACLMGAAYFFNRNYWNYLRGYEGLRMYGREEEYISIKSWGIGNGCEMVKNCKIAHLYRKTSPNINKLRDTIHNILVISLTLFPSDLHQYVLDYLDQQNYKLLIEVMKELDQEKIAELRADYVAKGYNYDKFKEVNQAVKKMNGFREDNRKWYY